ncbi:MAG: SIS domain-containing protein [Erysipelotrichaceae bacterium]|nr:SIS domain-containing protein [Erysipelotrichaceae bacterium]
METMFQYICETPDQCRDNIYHSKELTQKVVDLFCERDYKRIMILSSGSSYHAALTPKYFVEKILKVKVEVMTSFTALHYERVFDEDTFYIGMGQSGRSNNTNQAMQMLRDAGCKVVGVTGNVESVMKNHCDLIVNWGMGIEKIGFVTKGFSTGVLFYMLFALEAALKKQKMTEAEYASYKDELLKMCDVIERAIPVVNAWYERNADGLYDFNRAQVLGVGPGFGAALEGALKMQETMGKACTAFEAEEFLHGPCYEINGDKTLFILDTGGQNKERILKLYHEVHRLTENVYLITNTPVDDSKACIVEHDLSEDMAVLINIISMQIVAANGHAKWVNPMLEKRVAFTEAMDTKSAKTGKEIGL